MSKFGAIITCTRCAGYIHPVYYGGENTAWRCMTCEKIYTVAAGWRVWNGELVRIYHEEVR